MAHQPSPPIQRMDATKRREQILACATRLFEERPHHEVSMDEVAELAGVARPLVHHYFGTKRNLYLEVVRHLYAVPELPYLGLQPAAPDGLEAAVHAVVERWVESVWRHRSMWLVTVAGPGSDPEVAAIMRQVDQQVSERLIQALGLAGAPDQRRLRALLLSFGGLAKAASHEWLVVGSLNRDDVSRLLRAGLLAAVEDVVTHR